MQGETPRVRPDRQLVQGYEGGAFTVSGVRHTGSILVFPDRVLAWPVHRVGELSLPALEPVRAAPPDILVVGTGTDFSLFPPALREAVRAWGSVVEVMATPAACRTYNLLLAEERHVAAALIAV